MEPFGFKHRASWLAVVIAFVLGTVVPAARAQSESGTPAKKPRSKSAQTGKKPKVAAPAVSNFETRRADWIRRKEAANAAGTAGPDPLEQYLVSEVLVTGLFETDIGFGVFLYATPTGNTFFATNDAKLHNGRLVSIDKHAGGFADEAQIVFEERVGKGAAQRVVKRVVPVPSKVEVDESEPEPAEKPAKGKPESESPSSASY